MSRLCSVIFIFTVLTASHTFADQNVFNEKDFIGRWMITTSTCGKELTDEEIKVVIDNRESISHSGYVEFNGDGTYSQVINSSPYCKKGKPENKNLYMENYYCGLTAQTDGTYKFHDNGSAEFDGHVISTGYGTTASIGLDDWRLLQWQRKGKVLVITFPPGETVSGCMNKVMRRYYTAFEGT